MDSNDGPSDAEIIARVLRGETDVFGLLVRRYQNRYVRFAVSMVGSQADAEDVLQAAFVRAYRHLRRCRQPERFGAWLHQIVVNECRTALANQVRYEGRFTHDPHGVMALFPDPAHPADAPLDDDLQRALNTLPPDQREAVVLKYAEEMSYDEMAAVTGVGISALKMRTKRGIARLQTLLNGGLFYAE